QQLQLLGKQLEIIQGNNPVSTIVPQPTINEVKPIIQSASESPSNASTETRSEEEIKEHKKPFGASPKIERQAKELAIKLHEFLKELITSYNKKTSGSKSYAQKHRAHMADPRVVSGFKPLTKELVYPL